MKQRTAATKVRNLPSFSQAPPSTRLTTVPLLTRHYAEEPRYERDRSASPRPTKRDDDYPKRDDTYRGGRDRSASPNGRVDSR